MVERRPTSSDRQKRISEQEAKKAAKKAAYEAQANKWLEIYGPFLSSMLVSFRLF